MMGDTEAADLNELAEHNPDRFEGEETTDKTVEEMLAACSTSRSMLVFDAVILVLQ